MRTLVVACVLMIVYTAESGTIGNIITNIESRLGGLNGSQLREYIKTCGKKKIEEMSDSEKSDAMCCMGKQLNALNEDKVDMVKVLGMCDTCVTPPNNQLRCKDNTWFCYRKVEEMQIQSVYPQNKAANFCNCVVERNTLDLVDK